MHMFLNFKWDTFQRPNLTSKIFRYIRKITESLMKNFVTFSIRPFGLLSGKLRYCGIFRIISTIWGVVSKYQRILNSKLVVNMYRTGHSYPSNAKITLMSHHCSFQSYFLMTWWRIGFKNEIGQKWKKSGHFDSNWTVQLVQLWPIADQRVLKSLD